MYDILIIGGGPAGVSAALTAHSRGRTPMVLSNPIESNPLARAERVSNYPGMPDVTGQTMLEVMTAQLDVAGIERVESKVVQIMALGDRFLCAAGAEVYEGKALILAMGHMPQRGLPGEQTYLGRGLSYCATCDGMLYRQKTVAVLGFGAEAPEEAAFLSGIGCKVLYFGRGPKPDRWDDALEYHQAARYAIQGDGDRVTGLEADGSLYAVEGVFLLRDSVVADSLLPGLEMHDGHIGVDAAMATSVPGVFAAGDCVGKPYQVAKAAGEGNIAALSADRWLTASTEGVQ